MDWTEVAHIAVTVVVALAAMYFQSEASRNREQVRLLQVQRRTDREFFEKGNAFVPVIEGLWPELDEKERIKDRVRELEAEREATP